MDTQRDIEGYRRYRGKEDREKGKVVQRESTKRRIELKTKIEEGGRKTYRL